MRSLMSVGAGRDVGNRLGNRMGRSQPAGRTTGRYHRYLELRKQRRRRGVLWAILAAAVMMGAWDVVCRVDEASYNQVFVR